MSSCTLMSLLPQLERRSLEKLDAPTRVKLRSTQILTSLPQIVTELVQNSLDARATAIDIGVDCQEWYCWVKDNGFGISKDGLSVLGQGSEAGRYGMYLRTWSLFRTVEQHFSFRDV